jgi:hypothetical protein
MRFFCIKKSLLSREMVPWCEQDSFSFPGLFGILHIAVIIEISSSNLTKIEKTGSTGCSWPKRNTGLKSSITLWHQTIFTFSPSLMGDGGSSLAQFNSWQVLLARGPDDIRYTADLRKLDHKGSFLLKRRFSP